MYICFLHFSVKQVDCRFCVQINSWKDIEVCRKENAVLEREYIIFFQIHSTADRLVTDKINFHIKGLFLYFKLHAKKNTFFEKRKKNQVVYRSKMFMKGLKDNFC